MGAVNSHTLLLSDLDCVTVLLCCKVQHMIPSISPGNTASPRLLRRVWAFVANLQSDFLGSVLNLPYFTLFLFLCWDHTNTERTLLSERNKAKQGQIQVKSRSCSICRVCLFVFLLNSTSFAWLLCYA